MDIKRAQISRWAGRSFFLGPDDFAFHTIKKDNSYKKLRVHTIGRGEIVTDIDLIGCVADDVRQKLIEVLSDLSTESDDKDIEYVLNLLKDARPYNQDKSFIQTQLSPNEKYFLVAKEYRALIATSSVHRDDIGQKCVLDVNFAMDGNHTIIAYENVVRQLETVMRDGPVCDGRKAEQALVSLKGITGGHIEDLPRILNIIRRYNVRQILIGHRRRESKS